jgi:hypothetical protein
MAIGSSGAQAKHWASAALELIRWANHRNCALNGVSQDFPVPQTLSILQRRKIDSLAYLRSGSNHVAQNVYDKVWQVQRRALDRLLSDLASAGVRTLTFKGSYYVPTYFDDHALSLQNDVDILIPRTRVTTARRIAYDHGLSHGIFDETTKALIERDVLDVAKMEASHYELAQFNRIEPLESLSAAELNFARHVEHHPLWVIDDRAYVVIEVDIHHGVATDVSVNPLFNRAIRNDLLTGETFHPSDHLWFTAARYYMELALHGKDSLRDLAYLSGLLSDPRIDWEIVLQTARELELRCALFYILSFFACLLPSAIPEGVLPELNPSQSIRVKDFGWQLDKLFDLVAPNPFTSELL